MREFLTVLVIAVVSSASVQAAEPEATCRAAGGSEACLPTVADVCLAGSGQPGASGLPYCEEAVRGVQQTEAIVITGFSRHSVCALGASVWFPFSPAYWKCRLSGE